MVFPQQTIASVEIIPHISVISNANVHIKLDKTVPAVVLYHNQVPNLSAEQFNALLSLLNVYRGCFHITNLLPLTHLVSHHIETGSAPPTTVPLKRQSQPENDEISILVNDVLQLGVIQPSCSTFLLTLEFSSCPSTQERRNS